MYSTVIDLPWKFTEHPPVGEFLSVPNRVFESRNFNVKLKHPEDKVAESSKIHKFMHSSKIFTLPPLHVSMTEQLKSRESGQVPASTLVIMDRVPRKSTMREHAKRYPLALLLLLDLTINPSPYLKFMYPLI
jgi:hypothetical protein